MDRIARQLQRVSLQATASTSRLPCVSSVRFVSSAPASEPYPFSSTVKVLPRSPAPPAQKTDSLMRTLNAHLTSQHSNAAAYLDLFSRRSSTRLLPGSVLTVTSYATPPTDANPTPATTVFSGVLIASRRRHQGRDTSIRLRNLVGKTGVEMSFKVFSPLIKDIKVVQRAETSGAPIVGKDGVEVGRRKPVLRAARRAKMYFVRDQPSRLASVAGIVRQAREKEAALASRKRR
ncbi:hypothetical protein JCM10212_005924 [Sporobolomyces blumeae]